MSEEEIINVFCLPWPSQCSFCFVISVRLIFTFDAAPPVVRLYPVDAPDASGLDALPLQILLEPLAVFAAKAERPIDRDDITVPIERFEVTALRWLNRMWACSDWKRIEMINASREPQPFMNEAFSQ